MLSEEFMRNCVDMFSVPSRGLETNLRAFPQKHLNIIDPLKENNNLGRSVHRGNIVFFEFLYLLDALLAVSFNGSVVFDKKYFLFWFCPSIMLI